MDIAIEAFHETFFIWVSLYIGLQRLFLIDDQSMNRQGLM